MAKRGDFRDSAPEAPATAWKTFYDTLQPHLDVVRLESQEYVQKLERLNLISADSMILDFGCGAGFIAQMLAPKVKKISLWDLSETMQGLALSHTAGCSNVTLLDLSGPQSSGDGQKYDLILVNSVIQYMELGDFIRWLSRWRQMLRERGKVVVSDIISPGVNPFRDLGDMLGFWLRNRILSAFTEQVPKLIQYRQTRQMRPLLRIEKETLARLSHEAGFQVEFLAENLTHFTARITAVLST